MHEQCEQCARDWNEVVLQLRDLHSTLYTVYYDYVVQCMVLDGTTVWSSIVMYDIVGF